MSHGKNICKQLKEVRKRIAEENGIPLEIKECTYKGECRGTCPRCEAEVRYLENALADKLKFGKVATIAGLSLGLAACGGHVVQGEVPYDSSSPIFDDTLPADTLQNTDTAKPIWREPGGSLDVIMGEDVVLGGLEILDDTPPPESANNDDDDLIVGDANLIEGESSLYYVVEEEPEFPGGLEALNTFLQNNIKYPVLARDSNIQGKVYLSFVVEKDGSISWIRVLRDIGGGCGQEAMRVLKLMPRWKPAKNQGQPVQVQYNIPITFSIPQED